MSDPKHNPADIFKSAIQEILEEERSTRKPALKADKPPSWKDELKSVRGDREAELSKRREEGEALGAKLTIRGGGARPASVPKDVTPIGKTPRDDRIIGR